MAFIYFVVQFDYLGTMQAFFLLWSVKYPVYFRYLKRTGKMRYAHITGVLLILFGPLFGPLLVLADGYLISITDSPYLAAFGRNRDHFFHRIHCPCHYLSGRYNHISVFYVLDYSAGMHSCMSASIYRNSGNFYIPYSSLFLRTKIFAF